MSDTLTQLKTSVAELEQLILAKHPKLSGLLKDIWSTLKQYPENVVLLSEEEMHVIVNGIEAQTNTYLANLISAGTKKARATEAIKTKVSKLGEDAF